MILTLSPPTPLLAPHGIGPALEKVLRAVREEYGDVFELCPRCRCCELTVDFNWFREREKFCSGRCDERGFHIERPERVALLYERCER